MSCAGRHDGVLGQYRVDPRHVESVHRRFVYCRWVEVVGEVIRKQVLRRDFSSYPLALFGRADVTSLHYVDEWPDPNLQRAQDTSTGKLSGAREKERIHPRTGGLFE